MMKPGGARTFSCPSCSGTVELRASGISISAVCSHCGSVIDTNNDNFSIIRKAAVKVRETPIPLGRRATLFGIQWEVIGYCERTDGSELYEWREYLLFNPYQGFRFLTEADGHWSFVTMLREDIGAYLANDAIHYRGDTYRVFVRGQAKVKYVMGEFFWRVKVGETTTVADYVAAPYMLSYEQSDGDIVWSHAQYLTEEVVVMAFGLPLIKLSRPSGVAPNQPSPCGVRLKKCSRPFLYAFMLLMGLQILFVSMAANLKVYERMYGIIGQRGQTIVTDVIEVPGDTGNLQFDVYAPLNNNWLELNMSLVNEATQESENFLHTVEYYYGSDSDGPWREGAQESSTMLSAVPGGKYRLVIEPDSGIWPPPEFKVKVIRDAPTWGLCLAALGILGIYPFWLALRHWAFERRRWENSDYAPTIYGKGEDSDD